MTCGPFIPSRLKRGSYLPLPHELYTAFVAAGSAGESAMMAPGLRSRLGHPSSRLPIPGANESSTVEWQSAQVTPTRVSRSLPSIVSTVPLSPTTAFSLSSAMVVSGALEADAAVLDALDDRGGKRLRIHLQADRKRRGGIDRLRDDLVHAQGIRPLRLVSEGVEAERLLSMGEHRRAGVPGSVDRMELHAATAMAMASNAGRVSMFIFCLLRGERSSYRGRQNTLSPKHRPCGSEPSADLRRGTRKRRAMRAIAQMGLREEGLRPGSAPVSPRRPAAAAPFRECSAAFRPRRVPP